MHSSRMRTARSSSRRLGQSASVDAGIPPWVWAWRPPWVWAWRPSRVWAWRPPRCGPGEPPWPDPSISPLGVGLETCKACWDTPPGDLQGMLGYHLQGMLGYNPPPRTDRHVKKHNLCKFCLWAVIIYSIGMLIIRCSSLR